MDIVDPIQKILDNEKNECVKKNIIQLFKNEESERFKEHMIEVLETSKRKVVRDEMIQSWQERQQEKREDMRRENEYRKTEQEIRDALKDRTDAAVVMGRIQIITPEIEARIQKRIDELCEEECLKEKMWGVACDSNNFDLMQHIGLSICETRNKLELLYEDILVY